MDISERIDIILQNQQKIISDIAEIKKTSNRIQSDITTIKKEFNARSNFRDYDEYPRFYSERSSRFDDIEIKLDSMEEILEYIKNYM